MATKIVPTVTPFAEGRVNSSRLRRHVGRLLKKGIDYIFLCGTTGLGPSLTAQEKLQCLRSLQDFAGRIIFQVGSLNLDDSLMLAREAKRLKVHAIASYPPYFYPRLNEDWAVEHFTALSKVYPLIAYNFPLATGFEISPSLIKRSMSQGADIIGIKDTINDLGHMLSFKYELGKDFAVYSGADTMILSVVRSGLDGAIAGSGNYAPELLGKLCNISASSEAEQTQQIVSELVGLARKFGQWAANYALVEILQGYGVGEPRPPVFPLSAKQKEEIRRQAMVLVQPRFV